MLKSETRASAFLFISILTHINIILIHINLIYTINSYRNVNISTHLNLYIPVAIILLLTK